METLNEEIVEKYKEISQTGISLNEVLSQMKNIFTNYYFHQLNERHFSIGEKKYLFGKNTFDINMNLMAIDHAPSVVKTSIAKKGSMIFFPNHDYLYLFHDGDNWVIVVSSRNSKYCGYVAKKFREDKLKYITKKISANGVYYYVYDGESMMHIASSTKMSPIIKYNIRQISNPSRDELYFIPGVIYTQGITPENIFKIETQTDNSSVENILSDKKILKSVWKFLIAKKFGERTGKTESFLMKFDGVKYDLAREYLSNLIRDNPFLIDIIGSQC